MGIFAPFAVSKRIVDDGEYVAKCVKIEIKPNTFQNGTGELAVFSFEITEGENTGKIVLGRCVFYLSLKSRLAEWLRGFGITELSAGVELEEVCLNKQVKIYVENKISKSSGGEFSNVIKVKPCKQAQVQKSDSVASVSETPVQTEPAPVKKNSPIPF